MRSDARQSEYAAQLHLEFAKVMGWLRVTTPAVFTVTNSRRVPGVHRYTLRLYCAEPSAIHLLPGEEGCYEFTGLERWAGALLRHLTTVAGLLSHIAGLTGDVLGMSARDLLGRSSEDLKNMGELLEHLKATGESLDGHATEFDLPRDRAANDSDARAVEQLLHHLDPSQRWGGLSKTTTPAGLTLYLCADHEAAYRSPSPRPRGI